MRPAGSGFSRSGEQIISRSDDGRASQYHSRTRYVLPKGTEEDDVLYVLVVRSVETWLWVHSI